MFLSRDDKHNAVHSEVTQGHDVKGFHQPLLVLVVFFLRRRHVSIDYATDTKTGDATVFSLVDGRRERVAEIRRGVSFALLVCTHSNAIKFCAIGCVCSSNRNYLKRERVERESVPMKKTTTRGERTCSFDIRVLITVV